MRASPSSHGTCLLWVFNTGQTTPTSCCDRKQYSLKKQKLLAWNSWKILAHAHRKTQTSLLVLICLSPHPSYPTLVTLSQRHLRFLWFLALAAAAAGSQLRAKASPEARAGLGQIRKWGLHHSSACISPVAVIPSLCQPWDGHFQERGLLGLEGHLTQNSA